MDDLNSLREDFIVKSFDYVKKHGLSDDTLEKVALEVFEDISFYNKLFSDVSDYLNFYAICENKKFHDKLNQYEMSKDDKISDLVFKAIKLKIQLIDKDFLKKIVKFSSLNPKDFQVSLDSLYRTSDTIWSWLGDNNVDFSFYSKRVSLSLVISSTLVFYCSCNNEVALDNFIKTQLNAFSKIAKFKNKIKAFLGK